MWQWRPFAISTLIEYIKLNQTAIWQGGLLALYLVTPHQNQNQNNNDNMIRISNNNSVYFTAV